MSQSENGVLMVERDRERLTVSSKSAFREKLNLFIKKQLFVIYIKMYFALLVSALHC